jgi:hypothetical protein
MAHGSRQSAKGRKGMLWGGPAAVPEWIPVLGGKLMQASGRKGTHNNGFNKIQGSPSDHHAVKCTPKFSLNPAIHPDRAPGLPPKRLRS